MESGSADAVVKLVTEAAAAGLRERFQHAAETKKRASESVEAGRQYVAAYVELMHYTERLYDDAARFSGHDHSAGSTPEAPAAHGH